MNDAMTATAGGVSLDAATTVDSLAVDGQTGDRVFTVGGGSLHQDVVRVEPVLAAFLQEHPERWRAIMVAARSGAFVDENKSVARRLVEEARRDMQTEVRAHRPKRAIRAAVGEDLLAFGEEPPIAPPGEFPKAPLPPPPEKDPRPKAGGVLPPAPPDFDGRRPPRRGPRDDRWRFEFDPDGGPPPPVPPGFVPGAKPPTEKAEPATITWQDGPTVKPVSARTWVQRSTLKPPANVEAEKQITTKDAKTAFVQKATVAISPLVAQMADNEFENREQAFRALYKVIDTLERQMYPLPPEVEKLLDPNGVSDPEQRGRLRRIDEARKSRMEPVTKLQPGTYGALDLIHHMNEMIGWKYCYVDSQAQQALTGKRITVLSPVKFQNAKTPVNCCGKMIIDLCRNEKLTFRPVGQRSIVIVPRDAEAPEERFFLSEGGGIFGTESAYGEEIGQGSPTLPARKLRLFSDPRTTIPFELLGMATKGNTVPVHANLRPNPMTAIKNPHSGTLDRAALRVGKDEKATGPAGGPYSVALAAGTGQTPISVSMLVDQQKPVELGMQTIDFLPDGDGGGKRVIVKIGLPDFEDVQNYQYKQTLRRVLMEVARMNEYVFYDAKGVPVKARVAECDTDTSQIRLVFECERPAVRCVVSGPQIQSLDAGFNIQVPYTGAIEQAEVEEFQTSPKIEQAEEELRRSIPTLLPLFNDGTFVVRENAIQILTILLERRARLTRAPLPEDIQRMLFDEHKVDINLEFGVSRAFGGMQVPAAVATCLSPGESGTALDIITRLNERAGRTIFVSDAVKAKLAATKITIPDSYEVPKVLMEARSGKGALRDLLSEKVLDFPRPRTEPPPESWGGLIVQICAQAGVTLQIVENDVWIVAQAENRVAPRIGYSKCGRAVATVTTHDDGRDSPTEDVVIATDPSRCGKIVSIARVQTQANDPATMRIGFGTPVPNMGGGYSSVIHRSATVPAAPQKDRSYADRVIGIETDTVALTTQTADIPLPAKGARIDHNIKIDTTRIGDRMTVLVTLNPHQPPRWWSEFPNDLVTAITAGHMVLLQDGKPVRARVIQATGDSTTIQLTFDIPEGSKPDTLRLSKPKDMRKVNQDFALVIPRDLIPPAPRLEEPAPLDDPLAPDGPEMKAPPKVPSAATSRLRGYLSAFGELLRRPFRRE